MAPTMDVPPEDLDRTRATALAAATVPVDVARRERIETGDGRPGRSPTSRVAPIRLFNLVTTSAGAVVLALLGLVGVFLLLRGRKAFDAAGWSFFTRVEWNTTGTHPHIGVLGLLAGTVIVAVIAVIDRHPARRVRRRSSSPTTPPPRLRRAAHLRSSTCSPPSRASSTASGGSCSSATRSPRCRSSSADHFGWIPIFRDRRRNANFVQSMFIAGIVVSLMVLPIIAAVTREVFSRTPPAEKEAALALGGTRWGMVRTVVLPFGRAASSAVRCSGWAGRSGETIAVSLLLPQAPALTARILENGGATISGFIALRAGGDDFTASGLMARRARAVRHDARHEHGRLRRDRPESLGRGRGGVMTRAGTAPPPVRPADRAGAAAPAPDRAPAPTDRARPARRRRAGRCRQCSALAFTWLVFTADRRRRLVRLPARHLRRVPRALRAGVGRPRSAGSPPSTGWPPS